MKLNKQCNLIFVLLTLQAVTLGALEWIPESTVLERDPFAWAALANAQPPVIDAHVEQSVHVQIKHDASADESFDWHVSAISNSNIPCALLMRDNQTLVVRVHEELGRGWKIDKILATSVVCKHRSGDKKELWL